MSDTRVLASLQRVQDVLRREMIVLSEIGSELITEARYEQERVRLAAARDGMAGLDWILRALEGAGRDSRE